MKYTEIQSLLDTHLAAVTDLPTLQTEDTGNAPAANASFSRAVLTTTQSVDASNILREFGGLYVIDLYYPINNQVAAAPMADAVIQHFLSAPLRLIGDEVTVQIEQAWRETLGRSNAHYGLQVLVKWHALI